MRTYKYRKISDKILVAKGLFGAKMERHNTLTNVRERERDKQREKKKWG